MASLPEFDPLPDELKIPVLLKVADDISTDDILPAGTLVLPYRSNIPKISEFVFDRVDSTYHDRAMEVRGKEGHAVAAMGDGGFMMNSQELETAKRLGVAFTAIIFNDNDYGLISWKQEMSRGRSTGTRLSNPDFKAYAESFGIKGYRPGTVAQLKSQLGHAISSGELCVVEIPVDQRVNHELIRKLEKSEQKVS